VLNDAIVENAEPLERPYKLADQRCLYLYVSRSGSKSFRLKYRFKRREKLLTLGRWPLISLAEARRRADVARANLADGIEPERWRLAAPVRERVALRDLPVPTTGSRFVYFIQASSGHIKIGVTSCVEHRRRALQTAHPEELVLLACAPGGHAHETELHHMFADYRDHGEWFSPTPALLGMIEAVRASGGWEC
jgi:hypothetical protein